MKENKTSIEARKLAKIWHSVKTSGMPYSKKSFSKKGGATGERLWEVLVETSRYNDQIKEDEPLFVKNGQSFKPNIPFNWGEDDYAKIIDNYVFTKAYKMGISIIKKRGRIPGVSPRKKEVTPACFAEDIFNVTESDLTPAEIEETEGYVLNPETGIYEEPIIPEDSLDNYDPITGEWKSLPGEDDVTLIGGEKHLEDSISKVMTDLGPIMERALKVGLIISVQPVIKQ